MSEFMYVYRGGDRSGTPEQMQQMMQKWVSWMKDLSAKGHLKDAGNPLEMTGKLVKGKAKAVTDGPYAETKDIVCGFTIVVARDIDEAVELSGGCPILEGGGLVEVRPILKMNM